LTTYISEGSVAADLKVILKFLITSAFTGLSEFNSEKNHETWSTFVEVI